MASLGDHPVGVAIADGLDFTVGISYRRCLQAANGARLTAGVRGTWSAAES